MISRERMPARGTVSASAERAAKETMEYLVTMTTQVPRGVAEREVANVRSLEAARASELVREGHVLRLWRPPLQPGEWRTIGLFAAEDPADLERTLASMPLRRWRTDDVIPLGPHANDPGRGRTKLVPTRTEFLTAFLLTVPPATNPADVDSVTAQETECARQLADDGSLIRLWTLPGHGRTLGHWQATDCPTMDEILQSLPMADWLTTETMPLARHPNDPASAT
jgi:muconolactone delta-isomerase